MFLCLFWHCLVKNNRRFSFACPALIIAGYTPTQTLVFCKPEKGANWVKYESFSPACPRRVTFWPLHENYSKAVFKVNLPQQWFIFFVCLFLIVQLFMLKWPWSDWCNCAELLTCSHSPSSLLPLYFALNVRSGGVRAGVDCISSVDPLRNFLFFLCHMVESV